MIHTVTEHTVINLDTDNRVTIRTLRVPLQRVKCECRTFESAVELTCIYGEEYVDAVYTAFFYGSQLYQTTVCISGELVWHALNLGAVGLDLLLPNFCPWCRIE